MAEPQAAACLSCLDESTLERFVADGLPPAEESRVARHVESCAACRRRLDRLQGSLPSRVPPFVPALPEPAARGGAPDRAGPLGGPLAATTPDGDRLAQTPGPGRRLPATVGAYRVVRELGRGAFGVVYQAHDDALDRPVAIKVARPEVVRAAGGAELYLKEARALARLDHPHIVRVYEARATAEGACYLVSQYVAGQSLAGRLAEGRPGPAEAARLVAALADALQHAHEQGIVHRDVKPANVLLDVHGKPYLADFGLALREDEVGRGPRLLGTPAYMSPEQARGEGHRVDGRSDVYSLGVVLYELLTGKRPFAAESSEVLLGLIADVDAPAARQKDRTVPAELDRICARALARRVQDRYGSAGDLAADLNAWLAGAGARATRPFGPRLGGFELRGRVGSGGMGDVYRAWQPSEQREVALKCLRRGDAASRERFLVEIRALARVEHPNLVRIYSSGADGQQLYYAMELIDGADFQSLYRALRQSGAGELDDGTWNEVLSKASDETRSRERPLDGGAAEEAEEAPGPGPEPFDDPDPAPPGIRQSAAYVRRVATVVEQVARAAQALHDKGVLHRDIKPGNIMLTRGEGRAVLMDLGIARLAEGREGRLTRTREFVGSLRYASPEQVLDAGRVDPRSDVYSLGATLWELLTLRPLYGIGPGVPDARAMLKIEVEEPEPVRKYNRGVPADLQAVVQKCLEKDPGRRYPSAAALADDLGRFLQGRPVQARPVGPAARLWRRCRRRPLVPALWTALLLLAAALAAFAVVPRLVPDRDPNALYVGVKSWVGYSPLAVARDFRLCEPFELKFVEVKELDDALRKIETGEIDVMMCPVETVVYARGQNYPVKAVLQADASFEADVLVARDGIGRFRDLVGKRVAYVRLDAPHFLLLAECERHGVSLADLDLVPCETVGEALELFNTEQVVAATLYAPFSQRARNGRPLASSGRRGSGEAPRIVDVLAVHERCLTPENRPKVQALVRGWCEAVSRLEAGEPGAVASACAFLGRKEGRAVGLGAYADAAGGMEYAGREANRAFFGDGGEGSEFRRRADAAYARLRKHQIMNRTIDPRECDGSEILRTAD